MCRESDSTIRCGSCNVFADLRFVPAAVAELAVKSSLITTISDTIREHDLTQREAAQLCGTDQPTLSKVLRGRTDSITIIDRMAAWPQCARAHGRNSRPPYV
jgi:predicted XRE-type DNA-binding protein